MNVWEKSIKRISWVEIDPQGSLSSAPGSTQDYPNFTLQMLLDLQQLEAVITVLGSWFHAHCCLVVVQSFQNMLCFMPLHPGNEKLLLRYSLKWWRVLLTMYCYLFWKAELIRMVFWAVGYVSPLFFLPLAFYLLQVFSWPLCFSGNLFSFSESLIWI